MSTPVPPPAPSVKEHLHALSLLTLNPQGSDEALRHILRLTPQQQGELLALADAHHVVIRALAALREQVPAGESQDWAQAAVNAEQARIAHALPVLESVWRELEAAGVPVVVMKSVDHWPDLGSDLDLFTTGDQQSVIRVMVNRFAARIEPQSWGDRLACKWNFVLPGLREAVEIHVGRLGQTGEHVALARRFVNRQLSLTLDGHTFPVPASEERVIVAVLQRMYRHFYFRLCDMADTAALVRAGVLDYDELAAAAEMGGIWPGVATYLCVVSDYVRRYCGVGLRLPANVTSAARFGGDKLSVGGRFLRVPKMPEGAGLYLRQVARTVARRDWEASFRLTLLPPLASAAALAYAITGSDKGIW